MLSNFSQYVVYDLFKLSRGTQISGALEFFIYDSIKIFILLAVIIFAISFVRSFFPPEKTRKILSHKKEFIGFPPRGCDTFLFLLGGSFVHRFY
jgi:uncharacterized membrane protein YraQ (UPF0718 family)